jgi:hypothetical protein
MQYEDEDIPAVIEEEMSEPASSVCAVDIDGDAVTGVEAISKYHTAIDTIHGCKQRICSLRNRR